MVYYVENWIMNRIGETLLESTISCLKSDESWKAFLGRSVVIKKGGTEKPLATSAKFTVACVKKGEPDLEEKLVIKADKLSHLRDVKSQNFLCVFRSDQKVEENYAHCAGAFIF